MPLLTELDLVWVLELQRCRAYGAEKCRAKEIGERTRAVFDVSSKTIPFSGTLNGATGTVALPEKLSREGREGGEGFFIDKIFDKSKINL
jgi:hypothetical protein